MYSLDTNAIIFLMSGLLGPVRQRFNQAITTSIDLSISTVVLYELLYGVHKSQRPEGNRKALESILNAGVGILPFSEADANMAASIRTKLERAKIPIGHYDTLIAGHAIAHGYTLVTANVREFSRVEDLKWEDWSS